MSRGKNLFTFCVLILLLCGLMLLSSCTPAASPMDVDPEKKEEQTKEIEKPPYYQGKTVRIIVPFAAGGGVDIYARFIASHLGKYLPGNPNVIVENKAGGGGAIGFHYLAEQKPDGLTLLVSSGGVKIRWLVGDEGHNYPFEELIIHGTVSSAPIVFLNSNSAAKLGIQTIEDLANIEEPILIGLVGLSGGVEAIIMLLAEDTGIPFKRIPGFGSTSEAFLAVLSGEVAGTQFGAPGYLATAMPHVKEGELIPLFQSGLHDKDGKIIRDPMLADVPTVEEVYTTLGYHKQGVNWEAINSSVAVYTLANSLFSPPGTPDEIVNEINEAYKRMNESEEFKKESVRVLGSEQAYHDAEAAEFLFKQFVNTSPDVIAKIKEACEVN
ncbi:MAG: tripartite tricarboxylate transporter substrate binding protein [Bacillota bacterium]|nr:tripartite tricarboxylate transporter substrate binding protein [Bacillota bacterium]